MASDPHPGAHSSMGRSRTHTRLPCLHYAAPCPTTHHRASSSLAHVGPGLRQRPGCSGACGFPRSLPQELRRIDEGAFLGLHLQEASSGGGGPGPTASETLGTRHPPSTEPGPEKSRAHSPSEKTLWGVRGALCHLLVLQSSGTSR